MRKLTEIVKTWVTKRKTKSLNRELKELEKSFQVKESGGDLYLLVNGIAFAKIDSKTSSEQAVEQLNNARQSAISYVKSID